MVYVKKDYDLKFKKEHYKQFKVCLKNGEYENLKELLKKNNLTNIQFVRNAIKDLKNKSK